MRASSRPMLDLVHHSREHRRSGFIRHQFREFGRRCKLVKVHLRAPGSGYAGMLSAKFSPGIQQYRRMRLFFWFFRLRRDRLIGLASALGSQRDECNPMLVIFMGVG